MGTNYLNQSKSYPGNCYQFIEDCSLVIRSQLIKIKPRLRDLLPLAFLIAGICFISCLQILSAQGQFYEQQEISGNYEKSKFRNKYKLADIPQLQKKVEQVYPGGSMKVFDEITLSDKEIVNYLNVDSESTFRKQTEQQSRFENGVSNMKFQQFYKGIRVENGGYSIKSKGKLADGSFEVRQFTPFLLYDVNLDINPKIQREEINQLVDGLVDESELIISDRFIGNFQLIWKIRFRDPGTKYAWIDANTGKILKIDNGLMHKNAPTEDYGTQSMEDASISNKTYLQTDADPATNGGVITYDFDLTSYFEIGIPDFTSGLIPSIASSSTAWSSGDADESVFQAHWMATNMREKYLAEFGIAFNILHIGANCDNCINLIIGEETICYKNPAAGTFKVSTLDEGWIKLSHNEESTLAEYDILGHELAHVYMNELLNPDIITSASLQEGIADMFGVFMESEFQSLDWIMGDNPPFSVRNLRTPVFPCFNEAAMNSTEEHDRGSALGFWFYNLVTEDEIDCGQALDMKTVLEIIIEALETVPFDADYPDLCTATLAVAEQEFGLQSTEYTSILGAWNKICVNAIGGPALDLPLHIQSSQTWSTNMTIDYDIYIEKGATLTVTSTLIMVPEVDIYVEDNSGLIVDGGTLTTENCQMWNGIHVAGEFDLYSPYAEEEFNRGRVYLKNGALLERAKTGIDAKDRYVSIGGNVYEFGGGIVDVRNSTISECVIGIRFGRYGWGNAIGLSPYDDPSYIYDATFNSNHNAIYSEYNLGAEIYESTFSPHRINYEGLSSKITAIDNTIAHGITMKSPYPVVPGSKIISNDFEGGFFTEAQGNYTPLLIQQNEFNGYNHIAILGETYFKLGDNEINGSSVGCFLENTGIKRRNLIYDNSFANISRANSVFGENSLLFIANCFSGTGIADIEINDGASIFYSQGSLSMSAGNCFEDDARIQTGTGTGGFLYWTKDGFSNSAVCEYPGTGNFTISLSQNEVSHNDCGVDPPIPIIDDTPICQCESGTNGCINAIEAVRDDIALAEGNHLLNAASRKLLIAGYHSCLDELIRQYIDTVLRRGDVEDVISFLADQPEFQYRIMAYGIMNNNLEFDRSRAYIDTLTVTEDYEEEFVIAQNFYLDYITDIDNFELQPMDRILLQYIAEKYNPYSGYARSIYYLLTHRLIERDFTHLDNSISQRSIIENSPDRTISNISMFPNPSDRGLVNISIQNFLAEKVYSVDVFNPFGQLINSHILNGDDSQVELGDVPGLYIIVVSRDNLKVHTERVIRL